MKKDIPRKHIREESLYRDIMVRFISEIYDGTKGDTEVYLHNEESSLYLCTISGEGIDRFYKELYDLIEKHKI